jgi:long-chain fatty acid transport protein
VHSVWKNPDKEGEAMKRFLCLFLVSAVVLGATSAAMATNGDNLIAIGPIARAMGGVGIAAPQDAISAVFSNPAGMCFGPYCPGSEVNFAGTLFMPHPSARITTPLGVTEEDSDDKVYAIPAMGLSWPINPKWRFGLAAYGVSGLGVDYRDTALFDGDPSDADSNGEMYTQLQIMKFSPNIAYLVNDNLSIGLGVHIDYSALDLGQGSSFNYGYGVQIGGIYKVGDMISLGLTYQTSQSVDHENVFDFDHDGNADDLELESPQEVGIGIAVEPMPDRLLLELNGKWVNWSSAAGYEDFDWDDQFVVALGAQFKPVEKLALRLGYNYGENPVQEHEGFDGTGPSTNIQGVNVNSFEYEFFRIVGFPAIVQHHLTAGVGYEFSKNFAVNLGYMHAFKETLSESGTGVGPGGPFPATLESELSEDSVEFGLTWRFE